MKNHFEIRGDTTVIYLQKREGGRLQTLISTEDLPRAQEFVNTWCLKCDGDGRCYVWGNTEKNRYVSLHRWITKAPKHLVVDHINHNTSDNRRQNVRLVTQAQNLQNLLGAMSTNKSSGIRGVTWHKKVNKWQAQVKINGKSIYLGLYEDLQRADAVVKEARAKMMPYSQEALKKEAK